MTDTRTDQQAEESRGTLALWAIIPAALIAGPILFNTVYVQYKSVSAWDSLRAKSEAHNVLVGAYRGCRNKVVSAGSIEECHLVVKDYAELKGLQSSLPQVLSDISSVSENIRNGDI